MKLSIPKLPDAQTLFDQLMLGQSEGQCVICKGKTQSKFTSRYGHREFVHDYHEDGYFGCKEVWDYLQTKNNKPRPEQLDNAKDYDPFSLYTSRDEHSDYKTYIASWEWGIKAAALKRACYYKCENCGVKGTQKTLHVHHKTYKRLYREQRRDVTVLCEKCHKATHKVK